MHSAIDQFREVVRASLGHAPEHIEPDRMTRFPTGGSGRAGWCKVFGDLRAGVFGDWRSGIYEIWTATSREQMTPAERAAMRRQIAQAKAERETAQKEAWRKAGDNMRYLWRQCRPVEADDATGRYLCHRLALDRVDVPGCIRFHPAMPYIHDGTLIGTWPAMVAPIVGADGQPRALHRTYLTPEGRKADVPGPVKKLTPACGLLAGASIRLHEPRAGVIGVAEGIETALAASCASSVPTVAAYSAGGLAVFLWPAGVQRLVIFSDHDDAGTKAAAELRARAERSGLAVNVMTPSFRGADWADVWAARGAVEVKA